MWRINEITFNHSDVVIEEHLGKDFRDSQFDFRAARERKPPSYANSDISVAVRQSIFPANPYYRKASVVENPTSRLLILGILNKLLSRNVRN